MKILYPIHINELRLQIDNMKPKKTQLFEEHNEAPVTTILSTIMIKVWEIRMVSYGIKITGI